MADINTENNDPVKTNERFSRNRGRGSGSKNRDGFFKHSDRRNEFYNSRGSNNRSNRSESYGGSSSNDNSYSRKPYKRNWTPPQGDGKRKRLEVGNRLKEPDIGVTEFIGDHLGFPGLVKERYSDFHVNEISLDGEVVKLTNQDIPNEPEETETLDDLKKCVPDNIWEQLQALKEEESSSSTIEIDVTDVHKDVRRTIHEIAKRLANVTSQTIDQNDKKLMIMMRTNKGNKSKNDQRFHVDDRINWKKHGGDYCYFSLHKVNMDTMDALNQMAMILRTRPNNFSYAGTKDRRAWTTQWVSLKKTPPKKILRAGYAIRGAYVGNFKFEKVPLKLGMLRGNRFKIAIRNVIASNEEIEKAMISLRDRGFINYYGLQRFGTVAAIPTHEIGKKLLQGKWNEAIDLILKPREGEKDQGLAEGRKIYETTKDAHAAYNKIQRSDKIEATLLKGLTICTDKNPQGALDLLPRNIRLMYIHAYQSFIWNQIVSKRIKEFGTRPIVGDLVYSNKMEDKCSEEHSEQLSQDNSEDAILDNDETNNSAKEDQNEMVSETYEEDIENDGKESNNDIKEVTNATEISLKIEEKSDESNTVENKEEQEDFCHIPSVKILTEEDLPNYTLNDIIMPQPGWKVTYPPYAKPWFDEILAKDGLTTDLRQNNKKYSLGGAYRKILQIPKDLSWKIMHYKAKHDNLISSDIDEMRNVTPPKDDPEGEFKALIVEMSLSASTYATMALREILKHDTSPQIQAAQSAAHDALVESNKTIDGESEVNNSDNKNTQGKEIEKEESERSNKIDDKMDDEMDDKMDDKMDVDKNPKEFVVDEKCLAESETEMQVESMTDDIEMN
ncbi:pseudouridylate synthase 7 homolog [Polistes fuscatus]|uniref:pseudouridylate synthase 7 homolog n=1 Tax=Polistes fuscatus TaxID=30207 RepID=UPI001CA7FA40|nr:pseudouridylate synthase 7 homolog [Polistes fuscatus]